MPRTHAKRLKRTPIYRGYCFDVVRDFVIWPNDRKLHRDLIIHRHNISVMVPVLDKNRLILIRQYRYGALGRLWEIPAGTIGARETPLACAKRELVEEIGYRGRKWKKLASVYASPGFSTEIIHCFAASSLVKGTPALEGDEIIEAHIFTVEQVRGMIRKKQIRDAKTLMALFYYLGAV